MNKGSNLNKEMFDSISKEYDFINNLITFGFHKKWKKEIVEISKKIKPKKILDLATGTADIAIELSTIENCKIIAVDPSSKMLKIGERKIQKYNTKSNIFCALFFDDERFYAFFSNMKMSSLSLSFSLSLSNYVNVFGRH